MSGKKCAATTKSGIRCQNKALSSGYCHLHKASIASKDNSLSTQPLWMKTQFLSGMGSAIVICIVTVVINFSNDEPASASQINNDNSIGIQNTGDGSVDVEITQIEGLSKDQYENLLSQLDDLQQDRKANQKVLNNLLELIDVKNLSITELYDKVADYEKRIVGLLQDEGVNDEIKSLVLAGDLDKAERLVDSYVTNHEQELAEFYYQQGQIKELKLKYKEAKISFEKAAFLQPKNSAYLNRAGLINETLANHGKAIEYFEQALASDLKTYGEAHPSVAINRNNLGSAYNSLGQYDKAIGYYEQALASDLKTYGEVHSSVAIKRNNLGLVYNSLGKYEKAIGYYEQALASDLKTYGEAHPSVARVRNNLGFVYSSLGQYDKAIGFYEQAMASDLKTYGEAHPNVARVRNNLGLVYSSLGQYDKATSYFEQALKSIIKSYGEAHPNVATTRNNLGMAYNSLGKYEKAIGYYEQALASGLKTYGEAHPSVARNRNNLG
jgi:tetratricopeptide (TPR) repeat protein